MIGKSTTKGRYKMKFGEKLKEARRRNGLSQVELADALGVHSMTVSRWELSIRYPDVRYLPAMTRLLHVSSDDLLGIEETT